MLLCLNWFSFPGQIIIYRVIVLYIKWKYVIVCFEHKIKMNYFCIVNRTILFGTNTIINYIEYAKDAWLVNPAQNIAGKLVDKETVPKYYFTDNSLLNLFLLDGNTSLLENYRSIGMSSFVHHHTRHRTDIGDKWQKDWSCPCMEMATELIDEVKLSLPVQP